MPSYVFAGPYPTTYTGGRDANGRNLGTVEPGDIRLFDDSPPDRYWTPEIPPGGALGETGTEGEIGQDAGPGAEGDAGSAPQDQEPQDGPVPAPPAVIPGS